MTLTADEIAALHEALEDEHLAWATYTQVLEDFGPVRPFSNIREAEGRHIRALESLFVRYGLEVPPNDHEGRVPRFASLAEACSAGVEGEVANDEMYGRLMASTERPDLLRVFGRLREASRDRHLPAFRRCVERGTGGRGRCNRRGSR